MKNLLELLSPDAKSGEGTINGMRIGKYLHPRNKFYTHYAVINIASMDRELAKAKYHLITYVKTWINNYRCIAEKCSGTFKMDHHILPGQSQAINVVINFRPNTKMDPDFLAHCIQSHLNEIKYEVSYGAKLD
jgi:hypothetical protein